MYVEQNNALVTSKSSSLTVLLRKAKTTSQCVEWDGHRDEDGYGRLSVDGRMMSSHREAWVRTFGPIPEGLCVLHKCDNPPCVNPEHLFLGTHQENMRDRDQKGRASGGRTKPNAKLRPVDVETIRTLLADGSRPVELARTYGVCRNVISDIKLGKTWRSANG